MFILRCHLNLFRTSNIVKTKTQVHRYIFNRTNQDSKKNGTNTDSNNKPPTGEGASRNGTAVNKQLTIGSSYFDRIEEKNKKTYMEMVKIFENRDIRRRNHVEFIYSALKNMELFGVHRDIEIYKSLINILPKGKYIPRNIFQAEFMHYPKQQQCIIDLLEQMEDNGVMPDYEMKDMLLNIFGYRGHPVLKYYRMMYWMPKFKNASPWPLPNHVPNGILELAKLAIKRMCTVDLKSKITVYETKTVENAIDDTWIVSGMSTEQYDLLQQHNTSAPLYVEGPFKIWLRDRSVDYFILRADPVIDKNQNFEETDLDDVSRLEVPRFGSPTKTQLIKLPSVHEQNDGTIFAICATGTSTKDSLLSWIRLLENDGNSILSSIPILFKFTSMTTNNLVPAKV